jgi:hypothetical protein
VFLSFVVEFADGADSEAIRDLFCNSTNESNKRSILGIDKMKRQSIELAACVSLVAYAAIVLAGQAVHWIPGVGCHRHSRWATARSVATMNDTLATETESPVARYHDAGTQSLQHTSSHTRTDRDTTIGTSRRCPMCHWFSMAQWQALPVQLAGKVVVLRPLRLPTCEVRNLTLGAILPRGPPLDFASSSTS